MRGFTLFATPLGLVGIAFTEVGLAAIQLPERTERDTARRVALSGARLGIEGSFERTRVLPELAASAADRIRRHLCGEAASLEEIALDMRGLSDFNVRVYELSRRVPSGAVITYGELALRAGKPGGARAVGRAMATNPFPVVVPCHRVMATGAVRGAVRPGGFSSFGGLATKARLLEIERSPHASLVASAAASTPTPSRQLALPVLDQGLAKNVSTS